MFFLLFFSQFFVIFCPFFFFFHLLHPTFSIFFISLREKGKLKTKQKNHLLPRIFFGHDWILNLFEEKKEFSRDNASLKKNFNFFLTAIFLQNFFFSRKFFSFFSRKKFGFRSKIEHRDWDFFSWLEKKILPFSEI